MVWRRARAAAAAADRDVSLLSLFDVLLVVFLSRCRRTLQFVLNLADEYYIGSPSALGCKACGAWRTDSLQVSSSVLGLGEIIRRLWPLQVCVCFGRRAPLARDILTGWVKLCETVVCTVKAATSIDVVE